MYILYVLYISLPSLHVCINGPVLMVCHWCVLSYTIAHTHSSHTQFYGYMCTDSKQSSKTSHFQLFTSNSLDDHSWWASGTILKMPHKASHMLSILSSTNIDVTLLFSSTYVSGSNYFICSIRILNTVR